MRTNETTVMRPRSFADRLTSWSRLTLAGFGLVALAAASASEAEAQGPGIVGAGNAVVTGFSGVVPNQPPPGEDPIPYLTIDTNGPAARVVDLTMLGPQGQLSNAAKPFTVAASQVGQVFGVALDNAPLPSIYLAASSAYGLSIYVPDGSGVIKRITVGTPGAQFLPGQFGPPELGGGTGSIWRVDGSTGQVTLFATVGGSSPGGPASLGGLAFDPTSQQLFAADRTTGLIYGFGLDGSDRGSYDHGSQGRPNAGLAPVPLVPAAPVDISSPAFDTENPATWGMTSPPRRIFALATHAGRLYYGVAQGPQIWSAGIAPDGSIANDARTEVDVPSLQDGNEIASITFDGKGRMYVAERGATTGDYNLRNLANGGQSRSLRFLPKLPGDPGPGLWRVVPEQYAIGLAPQFNNADGGIALGYGYQQTGQIDLGSCGSTVWSTGERLLDPGIPGEQPGSYPTVDGLQGNAPSLVEPQNMPPVNSWFVDYDDRPGDPDYRGFMGAITIVPCPGVYVPPVVCPPDTIYSNGQCVIIVTCPPGTLYRNGVCEYPTCPRGYVQYRGQCAPPPQTCPRDSYFYDGRCVPFCPPGLLRLPNGYCACPPNLIYRDGRCIPPNNCPPGMLTRGGVCWCPPNTHYNERQGLCLPDCPPNTRFDPRFNQCVPQCPPDTRYDPRLNECVPQCPPNTRFDPRFNECVPQCPPLTHYDPRLNQCVPTCPPGLSILLNGKCGPPPCDQGQHRDNNGRCVPNNPCPPGVLALPNGACPPPPCDQGQHRDKNGRCVPNQLNVPLRTFNPAILQLACKPDEDRVGGKCVPKCNKDQIRDNNGRCIPNQLIVPLKTINPAILQLACKPDEDRVGGKCVPKCSKDQIRDNNGRCVAASNLSPKLQIQQDVIRPKMIQQ
jgi:hypothetical protein